MYLLMFKVYLNDQSTMDTLKLLFFTTELLRIHHYFLYVIRHVLYEHVNYN